MECMVTAVYWLILYDGWVTTWYDHHSHTVPIILLFVDWHLNKIQVEVRSVVPILYMIFGYSLLLITYSFTTGNYVYSILDFKTGGSWILLLMLDAAGITLHFILTGYSMFWFWLVYSKASTGSKATIVSKASITAVSEKHSYTKGHLLIVMDD